MTLDVQDENLRLIFAKQEGEFIGNKNNVSYQITCVCGDNGRCVFILSGPSSPLKCLLP